MEENPTVNLLGRFVGSRYCWDLSGLWTPTPLWKNLQAPRASQEQLSPLVQAGVQFLAVAGLVVEPDNDPFC